MKLGTLRNGTRDGQLIIVSADGKTGLAVGPEVPTLQAALDNWCEALPILERKGQELAEQGGRPIDVATMAAPLPRAYEWLDGSSFINHVVLVRKARGAEPPETLRTDPLVYQGGGGRFLGPSDPIPWRDEAWGLDFESEVCVVVDDVPQGIKPEEVGPLIRLVMIANDVSLRGLIPSELAKGFGFVTSKPPTAFAPFALTPDELGEHFRGGRLHLPLRTYLNGELFGNPEAGEEMHFSFHELIAHICKTRPLTAGSIIGSGTVSNEDRSRGSSCLAEKRMIEKIEDGTARTSFLKPGDRVEIEMQAPDGKSLFGRIDQRVEAL